MSYCMHNSCGYKHKIHLKVVSQSRPSRAERGSGEVPIVLTPTQNRVGVEC